MTFLVDTDVGLSLCACDCVQHLPACLGCSDSDIRYDSELRQIVNKRASLANEITPQGLLRAKELVRTCNMISDADVNRNDFIMAHDAGADDGEAELVSAIRSFYPDVVYVVTGDHKALRNLYAALPASDVRSWLMGHVVCLEQVLRAAVLQVGYVTMEHGLLAAQGRLKWLHSYYSATPPSEVALVATLEERIARLQYDCPNLLYNL